MEPGMGLLEDLTDPDEPKWDLELLRLSSDSSAQEGGATGHADFMSGWSATKIDRLMRACFWDTGHGGYGPNECGAISEQSPLYGEN